MSSVLLMLPTIAALSRFMPVTTWEPREFTAEPAASRGNHACESYVRDAERVISRSGIEVAHLISWCASVDIAAQLVDRQKVGIGSVALIAPILPFCQVTKPAPLIPAIDKLGLALENSDGDTAIKLFGRLQTLLDLSTAPTRIDATLQRLVRLNLATLAHARRRSSVLKSFYGTQTPARRQKLLEKLLRKVPAHVLCFEDDQTAGCPSASFASAHASATVAIHSTGGHFAPFKFPGQVCASLVRFYQSHCIPLAPYRPPA